MNFFNNLFIANIFLHIIGDYILQTEYIACHKSKSYYILLIHSILYTLPYVSYIWYNQGELTIFIYTIFMMVHFVIDKIKCCYINRLSAILDSDADQFSKYNNIALAIDQFLHYLIGYVFLLYTC